MNPGWRERDLETIEAEWKRRLRAAWKARENEPEWKRRCDECAQARAILDAALDERENAGR